MPSPTDADDVARAVRTLRDGDAVRDALFRFAAGQDLKDRALFRSAFSPDATLDFTQPARLHGGDAPVMTGRAAIEQILDILAPLATSHTVANPRVRLEEDRATIQALVHAMHVVRDDPARFLLLTNMYDVTLSREGDGFVIETMTIRNLWSAGDPTVLFRSTGPRTPTQGQRAILVGASARGAGSGDST